MLQHGPIDDLIGSVSFLNHLAHRVKPQRRREIVVDGPEYAGMHALFVGFRCQLDLHADGDGVDAHFRDIHQIFTEVAVRVVTSSYLIEYSLFLPTHCRFIREDVTVDIIQVDDDRVQPLQLKLRLQRCIDLVEMGATIGEPVVLVIYIHRFIVGQQPAVLHPLDIDKELAVICFGNGVRWQYLKRGKKLLPYLLGTILPRCEKVLHRHLHPGTQVGNRVGQHLQDGDPRIVAVVVAPQGTCQLLDILQPFCPEEREVEVVPAFHPLGDGDMFDYFWHTSTFSIDSSQSPEASVSRCCLAETRIATGVLGVTFVSELPPFTNLTSFTQST